jgi:hypothetical protein
VSNGRTHYVSSISEKDLVLVPLASAEPFLRTFFAAHTGPESSSARLVLHAGNAAHAVIADIERVRPPDTMTPCYAIHWESESNGPYPAFDGEVTVNSDAAFNGFWIVLTGAYVPPGGPVGQLFDMALGNRIARMTARALLREMRIEIEALYHCAVRAHPRDDLRGHRVFNP